MDFEELIRTSRSVRRFVEDEDIDSETLTWLIDCARLAPSAANLQPLRFKPVNSKQERESLYPALAWAGYLDDWPGPDAGERPPAYIIILGDRSISDYLEYDSGIAAQTILLAARSKKMNGCILGDLDRELIRQKMSLPENLEILLTIALGRAAEKVVIDENPGDPVTYYRDENNVHHVPKRPLSEIIVD